MEHNPEKFQKVSVSATIQTITQQIKGNIYVRQWERVKTMLDNMVEPFLAVTEAEVYNPRGELVYRSTFLAVQKAQIMWIDPHDSPENTAPPQSAKH